MQHSPSWIGRDYVQAAIDLVEEALSKQTPMPSVQQLADRIGYSVHHFSRLFSALVGTPPSTYLNGRVLTAALLRLRNQDCSLAAIAADAGFVNYEVFSRAFKRQFGISPRLAREEPGRSLAMTTPPILPAPASSRALASIEPERIEEGEHLLAGMWFFMDGSERSFHRPWNIFSSQSSRVYGVAQPRRWYQYAVWPVEATGLAGDGGMNILCSLEIEGSSEEQQEPFFSVRRLPARSYLRFVHVGKLDEIAATYQYIYGQYLAEQPLRLGLGWEFQRFGDALAESGLEICIPLA